MSIEPIQRVHKIYGYLRVSTDEQAKNGISIDTQKREITDFVRRVYDCEVDGFYTDDGVSGTIPTLINGEANPDRPAMAQLLNALEEYDVIVCTRLDRFSRSTTDMLNILPFFDDINATIYFSEQFGENAVVSPRFQKSRGLETRFDMAAYQNKQMMTQLSSFAEFERGTIADRFASGKLHWAAKGYSIGGCAPYGFKKEVEYHGNSKRRYSLVPDPETYPIFQHVMKLHNDKKNKKSLQKIADEINSVYPGAKMYKEKVKRIVHRKFQGKQLLENCA